MNEKQTLQYKELIEAIERDAEIIAEYQKNNPIRIFLINHRWQTLPEGWSIVE